MRLSSHRPHGQRVGGDSVNQAEIIAMATEAGLNSYRIAPGEAVAVWERFAALVAAQEREACALVCENFNPEHSKVNYYDRAMAESIRARGAA